MTQNKPQFKVTSLQTIEKTEQEEPRGGSQCIMEQVPSHNTQHSRPQLFLHAGSLQPRTSRLISIQNNGANLGRWIYPLKASLLSSAIRIQLFIPTKSSLSHTLFFFLSTNRLFFQAFFRLRSARIVIM